MTVASGDGLLIDSVSASFDGSPALREVTLYVARGKTCALMGMNGAGKTTLLNVCLGFLNTDRGRVLVDGVDILADPVRAKQQIAFVPEIASLYPRMTALENLLFFDGLMGRRHGRSEYAAVLRDLRFPEEKAGEPARTYSKGMRQKVALAIGLMKQASVFLLDEPSSGLDPESAWELAQLLRDLGRSGKAVLMTSHDEIAVEQAADEVVVLERGEIVERRCGMAEPLAVRA